MAAYLRHQKRQTPTPQVHLLFAPSGVIVRELGQKLRHHVRVVWRFHMSLNGLRDSHLWSRGWWSARRCCPLPRPPRPGLPISRRLEMRRKLYLSVFGDAKKERHAFSPYFVLRSACLEFLSQVIGSCRPEHKSVQHRHVRPFHYPIQQPLCIILPRRQQALERIRWVSL